MGYVPQSAITDPTVGAVPPVRCDESYIRYKRKGVGHDDEREGDLARATGKVPAFYVENVEKGVILAIHEQL